MKMGLSLSGLAQEIERQQKAKEDRVADTGTQVEVTVKDDAPQIAVIAKDGRRFGPHPIGTVAHQQIADHTGIPKKYYDKMLAEEPRLLATNIDSWFKKYPAPRLMRFLDDKMRAFLSNGYKPLDNIDLAVAALPTLRELEVEVMSCDLTERRLYIKAVDGRIRKDVPTGRKIGDGSHVFFDTVSPAVIIGNSEVGYGSLSIDFGVFTKVCTNLATISKSGMRRTHLGGKVEAGHDFTAKLTDETKAAKDRALWLEVRDTVKLAFDEANFSVYASKLGDMSHHKITAEIPAVIEIAQKKFDLNDSEGASILRHLIEGGDLTKYGLFNAITRTAQDADNYDRASELETLGGKLIDISPSDWRELAAA